MQNEPLKITLDAWEARYAALTQAGLREPWYGGPLGRHLRGGDRRLARLSFDNSPAALRLWNFLLTEDERLRRARGQGRKIVGAMKDLGTVPVIAYSAPNVVAFYPDGAWWVPCMMEMSTGELEAADALGINESFCPVRAMLGAFLNEAHFPRPDLLVCSAGAVCDDFSAIVQRLSGLGYPVLWWEIPHRRPPDPDEASVALPGGALAAAGQLAFVRDELERVKSAIEQLAGAPIGAALLGDGIRKANHIRELLRELRALTFTAERCPLPALELLIAEMLAIHFCSDRDEAAAVLEELLAEVRRRVQAGAGVLPAGAARVFWVNPVADLRVMNWLEDAGGRLCGTEFLFPHALDPIPVDLPPMEALARMALADPMVGSGMERAERICRDIALFGAEAVLVSRIPGASHCASESELIAALAEERLGVPTQIIEVPPISDARHASLRTRMEALVESVRRGRAS